MKNLLIAFLTSLVLTSCTYAVSMQHSEGSTDTLDENQTTDPTVTPTVNIPITPGAGATVLRAPPGIAK